jgi:DNA-binding CsgD family transcriptional regulator
MSVGIATEQQAFQGIKRACYAGLDSATLRAEVVRRIARVVPYDASNFSSMDPDTGLIVHALGSNLGDSLVRPFIERIYPDEEAASGIDQARRGTVVERGSQGEAAELLRAEGFAQELRALFFNADALWGSWCALRGQGGPAFADREVRFIERIAPHVAEGLKSAALLELALAAEGAAAAAGGEAGEDVERAPAPGYLVLDARGSAVLQTATAARCLADLSESGETATHPDRLPLSVASVRGRLLRRASVEDAAPADARLRVRGRSGAWYALRAALSEPDASGAASAIVSIEPLDRREVAPLLFRLYGLSPREREVIAGVVRGEPTKRIAHGLGLSTHTAQDYLDRACDKIGVRGRKALVAKLFRDGFAPSAFAVLT